MQIIKRGNKYHTTDGQSFITLGAANGHAKRLAVAHYFQVLRHQLHEETGPLTKDQVIRLRQTNDALEEIFEEKPGLIYEDCRSREQTAIRAEI